MKKILKELAVLSIGLLFAAMTFGVVELVCKQINASRAKAGPAITESAGDRLFKFNVPSLGSALLPDVHFAVKRSVAGQFDHEYTYTTNHFGHRVTVNPAKASRHALFLGGSCTFGQGVSDQETLPSLFVAETTDYQGYNFGVPAYGPQQILLQLTEQEPRREISQEQGIALYSFHDDYVLRAIGSMRISTAYGADMPQFYLDKQDRLIRNGSFNYSRPLTYRLYNLLAKSEFLKFAKVDLPIRINDRHRRLAFRLLQETARAYQQQFPAGKFYVLIYPGTTETAELVRFLSENQIRFFDYTNLPGFYDHENIQTADVHPNAKGNLLLAKAIVRDLTAITASNH